MMLFRSLFMLTLVAILVSSSSAPAAGAGDRGRSPARAPRQLELPDDEYVPALREEHDRSPAYSYRGGSFFTTQVNIDEFGQNIVGDAANEPSIAFDQTDSNRIAIGWRQFNTISSNFRQAGWSYTTDAGQTWTFPGVIEPGVFRSDPVLDSDSDGNFYYNSLTVSGEDFWCDVFISSDGGATWDAGTFAQGGDKQWMRIDKTGGIGDGNIYAFWSYSYSICNPGFFTRSADGGASYEACISVPGNPFWGTLAVGMDGILYVAGAAEDFVVARSSTAQVPGMDITWDFSTTVDLNGYIGAGEPPNPGGLVGQTWVATEPSTGPNINNVYLLCSVVTYGADPLDVMFARSTDGGTTWSPPVRVNDDPDSSASQWFGTMSVAPNGRIDVIWLDTRDDPGGYDSSLYYSYSTDSGDTWSVNDRLSDSFDPWVGWPQQNKMGDYFDMVSDNSGAHLAWAGTFNGEQDVYYTFISADVVGTGDDADGPALPRGFSLSQNYPNPFNPSTTIAFEIPDTGETGGTVQPVSLKVFDIRGRFVRSLVDSRLAPGNHTVHWNGRNERGETVSSGIYMYTLKTGPDASTRKMTVMK